MTTKTITYNNAEIYYSIYGSGKAIMLIHGFGEDGDIWSNQIEQLQQHYLLIVPDLPGSGKSSLLNGNYITIDTYAEVIHAILLAEKLETCTMLGHSMGGYITLAFAEKYPAMLNGFGLIHSSAFADSAEKIENRKKAIQFINQNSSYEFLKTSTPNLFYNKEAYSTQINLLIENGNHFTQAALVQYYEAMITRPNRTSVLQNFKKPILMIIGKHDQAIPFADSMQQTYLPTNAYIEILRHSAHMGMLEEVEKFNINITKYLKAI
jgi:pimeloyl-ACP methyl ester carboxylesterase